MRKLESVEKNGRIIRSWYIQKFDLESMYRLQLPLPSKLKSIFSSKEFDEFIKISDPITFEFIKSQNWMVDEWDYAGMNLYELTIALNVIKKAYVELIENLNQINNKEELQKIKTELIVKKNNYQSVLYLIEQKKKEELEDKRK